MGPVASSPSATSARGLRRPDLGALSLPAHVLVLDAAQGIGPWARDALSEAGLTSALVTDDDEALRTVDTQRPAMVLLPIEEVRRWAPVLARLGEGPTTVPVLGLASRDTSVDVTPALQVGVTDLLTYPCSTDDLVARVSSSMRGRRAHRGPERPEQTSPLAALRSVTEAAEEALLRTETAAARVSRAEERDHLRTARESLAHSLQVILGTMIGTAEAGGAGREGHARRVAALTRELATALGWPPVRVRGMELAGLFQDIGLLALPGDLLAAEGPLQRRAVELLRAHADTSAEVLEPLSRVGVPVAAVRAHHERLDGSGYPRGLRGRQIPFGAQVLAVTDTYAALTSPRPHRPAVEPDEALAVLRSEAAGGRLAAKLVELLHEVVNGHDRAGAATDTGSPGGAGQGDADGLPPLAKTSDGLASSF